jgi:hypothetical protein
MIESEIGDLFHMITDGEPSTSQINTHAARRRGRARLRRRRVGLAGTPLLAVAAAVVVALTAGAASPKTSSSPPSSSPPAGQGAPQEFDPLVPYLSFGWLPPGIKLVDGDILKQVVSLDGNDKLFGEHDWGLSVYAAGQCQLTTGHKNTKTGGKDTQTLKCAPHVYDIKDKIDAPAPSVNGHQAFWSGYELVWQYASDGWATLSVPFTPGSPIPKRTPELVQDAVKVASNVKFAADTPPLEFPLQLSGLDSQVQVSSVFYVPNQGVLQAYNFGLSSGTPDPGADGGLVYQKGQPSFDNVQAAGAPHSTCPLYKFQKGNSDKSKVETINGSKVVLTTLHRLTDNQLLCTANANGLAFSIMVEGGNAPMDPATLFRDHLKVLGANSADWTTKPIS